MNRLGCARACHGRTEKRRTPCGGRQAPSGLFASKRIGDFFLHRLFESVDVVPVDLLDAFATRPPPTAARPLAYSRVADHGSMFGDQRPTITP